MQRTERIDRQRVIDREVRGEEGSKAERQAVVEDGYVMEGTQISFDFSVASCID